MEKHNVVYAYYKGDSLKAIGTLKELSQKLGVSVSTIASFKSPSYIAREDHGNKSSLFKIADPPIKEKTKKPKDVYNIYKNNVLLATGTMEEISKELNLRYSTLMTYKTPSRSKKSTFILEKISK